jgi:serine/threonine-protein kinase
VFLQSVLPISFFSLHDKPRGEIPLTKIFTSIESFSKIEPIEKGWSEDKKYCVTTADGTKYLLRISPISRYEVRKSLFEMMEQIAALGIPMCAPVEFGTCDDEGSFQGGVYSLQSWIDGEDLETALPFLSETEQYVLGIKSGEIARKMHTIPAPETQEDWASRFNRKTDMKIQKYQECGLRFDSDDDVIRYINENRYLLEKRPQCFQHGDYHAGNMMLENGKLKIIDFDRYDFGDPWEEFNRIVWSAAVSSHFATGQIRGYFGGEPPIELFKLLAFYISSNTLSSIYWAIPFGQSEIDTMMKQTQDVLNWYDNMKNPVPTWYQKDFYIQYTDGVPYKLKSPFDFSFLSKYGKVFKVFDSQDSGNICFGIKNGDKKYFVKFAGAPKNNYIANRDSGAIDEKSAVKLLKQAVPLYKELAHPALIKFISAEDIGGGYAAVFEWEEAVGIEPKDSPNYMKFMQMPVEKKYRAFEDIMAFHAHVAAKGYVALDFYDGSILYDYEREKVVICDIDLYQKSPFINAGNLGIVGSARYVSPEECAPDTVIDEITNVYTMGATAFALFAFGNRSPEAWTLFPELYAVVKKAVSDERSNRQQSIEQLITEWRAAK